MLRKILLILAGLLLFIQLPFFTPEKNYSEDIPENDIATAYNIPMDVLMTLYGSCYDCHSNYTENYSWYYHIQPISWWMNLHIIKAKEDLNFSEFAHLSKEDAYRKIDRIQEVMEDQTMPLKSYELMHADAKLSDEDYMSVIEWAKEIKAELKDLQ